MLQRIREGENSFASGSPLELLNEWFSRLEPVEKKWRLSAFVPLSIMLKYKKLCAFALPKTSQELISSGGWEKCGWGGTRCFPEFKRDVYSKGKR